MSSIPTRKSKPRKPRENKGSFKTDEHDVLGGRVKVFRTTQSGLVYQMSVWFRENQKYYRKSLRTENLQEGIELSEEIYLDLKSKIRNNEVIFEYTSKELVDKYLEHRKLEVSSNPNQGITEGRWVTIRSQMKHFLYFVGEKTKLSSIPSYKFEEYFNHRINNPSYSKNKRPVRMLTLLNESSTINNFYNFCFERNYLDNKSKPLFPKNKLSKNKLIHSRQELTNEEWKTIYLHLRTWGKSCPPKEKEQKEFIRYFIILLCNTGLRFGEGRQLKWEDLSVKPPTSTDKNPCLYINLKRGKTGKRVVIGRRPDLYKKIWKLSKHTKPVNQRAIMTPLR
jgi:integrase